MSDHGGVSKALYTRAHHLCAAPFACGARLINFPQTWGEQRTPSAWKGHPTPSSFLCVRAKNWQISVCGEWYANHSQMARRKFCRPVHTYAHLVCKPFARVREPFGVLVYTRLKVSLNLPNISFKLLPVFFKLS